MVVNATKTIAPSRAATMPASLLGASASNDGRGGSLLRLRLACSLLVLDCIVLAHAWVQRIRVTLRRELPSTDVCLVGALVILRRLRGGHPEGRPTDSASEGDKDDRETDTQK